MVEVLRVVAWPIVILMVAVIVALIFRKPVSGLLNRFKRPGAGKTGFTLDADAVAASIQSERKPIETGLDIKATQTVRSEERLEKVKSFDVPPIVRERENLIQADLNRLGVSQQEQVQILVKHLAVTQLLLRSEYTYRTIFGSQIALLKFLNTAGGGNRAQLSQFYEDAKVQFPRLYADYSFEQYLDYLLAQGLIATEDHQSYVVTVPGKEFLKWISDASVIENKPF